MEAYITLVSLVKVVLTRKEAEWLRGYAQNYPFEDESEEDKEIRRNLFECLNDALR